MALSAPSPAQPKGATGVLVLADGTVAWGKGFGATGSAVGEVCFNTAMTGTSRPRSAAWCARK
jgi:carbamoyl-phosphate synthase small subunit